jgi:cytochrome c biogenesis protein CcdA
MLRLLGLVVTVAVVDSVNPSTIAPALYIASGERARSGVVEFTGAVFVAHCIGGAVLVIGPGRWLLALVNDLGKTPRQVLEVAAGAAMVAAAAVVWHRRGRLAEKDLPDPNPRRRSSVLLGAGIIAVELPTAFPYFAAIAAVVASDMHVAAQMLVVGVYNLCFVLPLIVILTTLLTARDEAQERLRRGRDLLQRRWPTALAGLLLLLGVVVAVLGATG